MREWIVETAIRTTALLLPISMIALAIIIAVLLPLAIWRKTRLAAGCGLIGMSFSLGLTTWFCCVAVTFSSFSWLGLVIGLLFFGLGVVPMGIIGAFFKLNSSGLGFGLCMFLAMTLATRFTGFYLLDDSDNCVDKPDSKGNKVLAIFGIGAYILSVLTSISDINGNPLMPVPLILISGTALLLFVITATIRLWKSARNTSIILASSTIILLVLGVILEATSPPYASPIFVTANILTIVNFAVSVWAIIRLFKLKENNQSLSTSKHVNRATIPDWQYSNERENAEIIYR